jgi:hypothetical protein
MPRELTTDSALAFVRHLADREANAIGFLPHTVYAKAWQQQRLKIVYENNLACGFILHGPTKHSLRIYQTAVDRQARLKDHGREAFLDAIASAITHDVERITWICAEDLPANQFWHRVSGPPVNLVHRPSPTRRNRYRYSHTLPRGEALEAYLDEHLRKTSLWRFAQLQGVDDWLMKTFLKRFRKGDR